MKPLNFNKTVFMKSAAKYGQCVPDEGREVAFVGRSNAGKSSALNTLVGRSIARVSKLPGRTQLINFFEIEKNYRLVDLPGYGFARVTAEVKQRWEQALTDYFTQRESLVGVVLLCDVRHPLKEQDVTLIEFMLSFNLPVHLLLTKADKLSKNEALKNLHSIRKSLDNSDLVSLQLFSSLSKQGLDVLEKQLYQWFFGD